MLVHVKKFSAVDKYYMWYDQTHLAAMFDKDRNMQQYYIWGINKFAPAIIVDLTNGRQYKIHSTATGSVRHIVDYEGKVIQEIEYDELGMIVNDTNPGFQPFGYNGGLWDPETQLVRFGARDYDPSVSRWTTKDPIGFDGGDTNLYGYVANDPVNWVDPSGNIPVVVIPGLIGGGVGAVTGALGAYYAGGDFSSVARGGAIGAAAGALSAYGWGGVLGGAAIGFGANVATQLGDAKSLQCIDYGSAAVSGAAGALGTYAGGLAVGRFQIPGQVIGQPLSAIGQSAYRSNGIISNEVGGVIGGAADVWGNQLYGH